MLLSVCQEALEAKVKQVCFPNLRHQMLFSDPAAFNVLSCGISLSIVCWAYGVFFFIIAIAGHCYTGKNVSVHRLLTLKI